MKYQQIFEDKPNDLEIETHETVINEKEEDLAPEEIVAKSCAQFFDRFVIPMEATWKEVFDVVLIFTSVYNVYANAFYSAFRLPDSPSELFLDQFIEMMFLFDMIFCFF